MKEGSARKRMSGRESDVHGALNLTALYVGSSLLAPLREAEGEINRRYGLALRVSAYNLGAPLADDEWRSV